MRLLDAEPPARVGDLLVLEIEVDGAEARLAPAAAFGPFELAGEPEAVAASGEGSTLLRVPLQVFATGRQTIPSLTVLAGARDEVLVVTTEPVPVDVLAISEEDAAPAPVKLVLPPPEGAPLAPAALGALVVTIAGYRAARWLAGRPAPGEVALLRAAFALRAGGRVAREFGVRPAPDPDARRRALEALRRLDLESRALDDVAAYHERLSRIAVDLASASLRLGPRERTTAELLRVVRGRCDARATSALGHVLGECDRVKFAAVRPSREEARALRDSLEALARAGLVEP